MTINGLLKKIELFYTQSFIYKEMFCKNMVFVNTSGVGNLGEEIHLAPWEVEEENRPSRKETHP
jgi:hypothetical protein